MTTPFFYSETFNILNNFIDEKYIIKNILDDVIDMKVIENKKTLLKELTKNNVLINIDENRIKYKRGQDREVNYKNIKYNFRKKSYSTPLEDLTITTNKNKKKNNIRNFGYLNKSRISYYY